MPAWHAWLLAIGTCLASLTNCTIYHKVVAVLRELENILENVPASIFTE